jgi:hypothetical protein
VTLRGLMGSGQVEDRTDQNTVRYIGTQWGAQLSTLLLVVERDPR